MIDRNTRRFLGFICAATVANAYYNQPLLSEFAHQFHVSDKAAGLVATCAQSGYGLGILFLIPLGDIGEKKSLIMMLLGAVSIALLITATASSINVLYIGSLLIGITTVVPQIVIPYAARLASPEERASVVGSVQAGLLVGILLARSVAGSIASLLGWRSVFFMAAGLMAIMAVIIGKKLPRQPVTEPLAYHHLMMSMFRFFFSFRQLRKAGFVSALTFGSFCAFWTTLSFLLETPAYGYGPAMAGAFGVIGVIGALIAPYIGKLSDAKGSDFTSNIAIALSVLSFGVFACATSSLWLLAIGVILIDIGTQATHISNQAKALSLSPEAISRLNGVYMVMRFIGGASGSWIGSLCWGRWGWYGVCGAGAAMCLTALAISYYPEKKVIA